MNHAGTLILGYGSAAVAVLGYVVWLFASASRAGANLDISAPAVDETAEAAETAPPAEPEQTR